MSLLQEFKEFAVKGNAVDLAVGVVIGAAFGKIVTALVDDLMMPVVGLLTGGVDFSSLKWQLATPVSLPGLVQPEPAVLKYGHLLQVLVDFVIVAFVLFLVIKGMNALKRSKKEDPKPAVLSAQEQLLTEIRDLLKQRPVGG